MAAKEDAELAAVRAIQKDFLGGIIEVAKGAIDRARSGAQQVQTAAASIATVYTAVLGVTFSVTDNPLPTRALIAPIFFGAAIVAATVYLAYISTPDDSVDLPEDTSEPYVALRDALRKYVVWTRAGTLARRYPIRLSVVFLAFGLPFMAAPFVSFEPASQPDAAEVEWPDPPTSSAGVLDAILYRAQVEEAATRERKAGAAIKWPDPPPSAADPRFEAIRYRAEVKEAADQRAKATKAPAREGHDLAWCLTALGFFVFAWVVPPLITLATGGRKEDADYTIPEGKIPTYSLAE